MNKYQQRGMSLIEQVIVVFIVGVIATIGWSTYDKQRIKAYRGDAVQALLTVADQMERCYQQTIPNSYGSCGIQADSTGTLCTKAINITCPLSVNLAPTKKGYYNVSISSQSNDNYLLLATPVAGGPQEGDPVLMLDAKGNKTGPWPN
jgi:prepilin-type N-terminal cleavage/methylation domain-containing protein